MVIPLITLVIVLLQTAKMRSRATRRAQDQAANPGLNASPIAFNQHRNVKYANCQQWRLVIFRQSVVAFDLKYLDR